ncbi:murein biosynthesis integral membrane protein MurJ [Algisphaera agarilytica]|uniref:Probable lipid II flippase MurJ n=1 Tax=Algisphaera agarilytica TaxID=1385975 RepID=A0A7X0LK32_9BACT|nr:murein biosynthesis integral membrane protein MurJ [Algisphaera agarilytica]MBB6429404.1 putative peptidoglycan lipid II flippase [Algisphaera agarilytica]
MSNPPSLAIAADHRPTHWRTLIRVGCVLYWLTLILATHWPGLKREDLPDLGWLPFDKTMHVLTFAGLAMWMTWPKWFGRWGWVGNALAAVGFGMAYGVIKEFTQPLVGRTGAFDDLVADAAGLIIGAPIAVGVAVLFTRNGSEAERADSPRDSNSTEPGGGASGGGGGFVGHAALVSALTLVSRMLGLVRDAVLAAVFGASMVLDAFLIGFIVPNLFRRLFGEGALTAAFIPRYTKLLKDDPALARRFASLCVVVVAMLLAGITLVGEVVLGVWLANADQEKTTLAIRLTMLMLPYMPMVCGVAFLGAILHVHRKFGPPAAAPVLLNVAMIVAALIAASQQSHERAAVTLVALSVLVAGAIQIAWMVIAVWKTAPLTKAFAGTSTHFRGMLVTMLPMVIGLGVFQINTLMDGLIAYGLAAPPDDPGGSFTFAGNTYDYPMETGAVTTLTLAQRLYQFPLGVFGIAIATAIFPALASAAAGRGGHDEPQAAEHDDEYAAIFRRGVRLTLFIGLPASVGLILVRVPLTRVFFEYGEFTADDALRSAAVLMAYASAVWAYSLTHVTTKAFYAVDDAMTPLKVSLGMVVINLVMNLTLIWPFGVAGLAWSTAISAAAQSVVLVVLLRKHVARPITAEVMRGIGTTLGLTLAMGVAVGAVVWLIDPVSLNKAQSIGVLALCVGLGAGIVLGGAWVLKLPEVRELKRR